MLRGVLLGCVLAGGVVSIGCSEDDCAGSFIAPSFLITVVDAVTKLHICDATVTIDGAPASPTGACTYQGPIPLGPTEATIGAEKPGYQTESGAVSTQYQTGKCESPIPRKVTVELTPE